MPSRSSDEAVVDVNGVCRLPAEHAQAVPPRLVGHQVTSELVEVGVRGSDLDDESSRLLGGVLARPAADVAGWQLDLVRAGRRGAKHGGGV